jgi:cyclopropane fatty-acyl-phospholipid synthase-like methyltransferase
VSTYVLMRLLESAPSRYDRGVFILTLGGLVGAYDRLISHVAAGERVLDLGCGTGALTLRAAGRGALVKAIDVNPQMLEVARRKARDAGLEDRVEFCEMGVAELDTEVSDFYDVVMSGLCFSELTPGEVSYALGQAMRILKDRGRLLVADEVRPRSLAKRVLSALVRTPLAIAAYVFTQTSTHPVEGLPEKVRKAGFVVESVRMTRLETLVELVATKQVKEAE